MDKQLIRSRSHRLLIASNCSYRIAPLQDHSPVPQVPQVGLLLLTIFIIKDRKIIFIFSKLLTVFKFFSLIARDVLYGFADKIKKKL